jgi:uncharacterized protein (DUF1697 family)
LACPQAVLVVASRKISIFTGSIMTKFVSILRGINVSGQKKIIMTDLKKLYENIGFSNVQTYIQSGNVVFESNDRSSTQDKAIFIKDAIFDKYKFEVPTFVYTGTEMSQIRNNNPFINIANVDLTKLYVTFLAATPDATNLEKLEVVDRGDEQFIIKESNIYGYYPNGYGRAKLNNTFIENKLKVEATSRNWKTVNRLVELLTN